MKLLVANYISLLKPKSITIESNESEKESGYLYIKKFDT